MKENEIGSLIVDRASENGWHFQQPFQQPVIPHAY